MSELTPERVAELEQASRIRAVIGWLIWAALWAWVKVTRRPSFTIPDPVTYDHYMTRYWLGLSAWPPVGPDGKPKTGIAGWYLHEFHRSDWARDLHNHPAPGWALILRQGYTERSQIGVGRGRVWIWPRPEQRRELRPLDVNRTTDKRFHRVALRGCDLLPKKAWTLFRMGERQNEWGFATKDGFVEANEYFRRLRVQRNEDIRRHGLGPRA